MRQIKDVLRLKLEHHHSHQHIVSSLGISKGVVAKYVKLASTAGLYWPQIQAMDETALHSRLMGAPQRASSFVAPDYAHLHQELRRKGMTLMLLWQEHSEQHPDASIHSYSQFCENYRRFAKTLKRSMRVRAHIFLCILAYCVKWHMRQAWAPLMFTDCDQEPKLTRDPVAPAKRSERCHENGEQPYLGRRHAHTQFPDLAERNGDHRAQYLSRPKTSSRCAHL